MKRGWVNSIKWALTLLFVCHLSSISFFTHTHIFNDNIYVHSHPFTDNHTHTESQLIFLEQIYRTSLTEDVIPVIESPLYLTFFVEIGVKPNTIFHLVGVPNNTQLRAPPFQA